MEEFIVKLPTYLAPQVMDIQGYARQSYAAPESVDTRRRALTRSMIGNQYLLNWVKLFRRKLLQIMDTKLEGQYPENVAVVVAALALQFTDSTPYSRLEMSQVLEKLQEAQRCVQGASERAIALKAKELWQGQAIARMTAWLAADASYSSSASE
uniref:Uncharacterized protein n=1 Tax=Chenopodium quinoa TaxID=63459 RepID=A0A803KWJ3_CHEQI